MLLVINSLLLACSLDSMISCIIALVQPSKEMGRSRCNVSLYRKSSKLCGGVGWCIMLVGKCSTSIVMWMIDSKIVVIQMWVGSHTSTRNE